MCVYVCACLSVGMHVSWCTCQRSEDSLGCRSSPAVLRQALIVCCCVVKATWPPMSSSPLPLGALGFYRCVALCLALCGLWDSKLRSWLLHSKCFYTLSHLLSPWTISFPSVLCTVLFTSSYLFWYSTSYPLLLLAILFMDTWALTFFF